MINILFFLEKDSLIFDYFLDFIGSQEINASLLYFRDPTTKFFFNNQTNDIIVSQNGTHISLFADTYVYLPRSLENRDISLYSYEGDFEYSDFVCREWNVVTRFIQSYFEDTGIWINNPTNLRKANNKLYLLHKAKNLGLCSPYTIATNDSNLLANNYPYDIGIYKCVSETGIIDNERLFRASFFNLEEICENHDSVSCCPSFFQAFIDAKSELRTYIIDDKAISVGLYSNAKHRDPDIRNHSFDDVTFAVDNAFKDYEDSLIRFTRSLGLLYAAVDSVVIDNKAYFLELNPLGTWEWLPKEFVDDIAQSFCELIYKQSVKWKNIIR